MSPVAMESPPSIRGTTLWTRLPAEIRRKILDFVCSPASEEKCKGLESPTLARFTTVCLEWQFFFEARIFRRLVLDPDSLDEFDAIITRHDARLGYIRKLWLRIRLSSYNCSRCFLQEDAATQNRHNTIFSTCIQSLLGTLRLWAPTKHGAQGLDLMLSVSSPSDTEHFFDRCEIKDNYPFHYAEDLDGGLNIVDFHRSHIDVSDNGDWTPRNGGHIMRYQGTPLRFDPPKDNRGRFINRFKIFPAVPIVKGLVMRKQFRREISVKTLSWLMCRSFVALEWFRFERNIPLDSHRQLYFDQANTALFSGFRKHLLPSLPNTLRQFSFTQWESPINESIINGVKNLGVEISSHAQAYLPQEMAKLSWRLEQFCPPWQMDAASFLRSIIELGKSPKMCTSTLKRLSLRCSLSTPDRTRRDFEMLSFLAAKAALSLPHLEIIELWGIYLGEEKGRAYTFQYIYEDGRPSIIWKSSGEVMGAYARKRIIAQWSEVAQKRSHYPLVDKVVPFKKSRAKIFKSKGTFIYRHLLLKDLMFDPITRIILENEPYEWEQDEESDEESDESEQDDLPDSDTTSPNSMIDDVDAQNPDNAAIFSTIDEMLANSLIPAADLALLEGDFAAFDTALGAFIQLHHE
ncbi:hypothetical protein ACQKWADRAFT_329253 [Trichoderma austrokoningii]